VRLLPLVDTSHALDCGIYQWTVLAVGGMVWSLPASEVHAAPCFDPYHAEFDVEDEEAS
jgi:hypothetical protein